MSKLTQTKFNRISQYIKMFEGDRETLQFAWANIWNDWDMEDYYDLTDSDIKKYISDMKNILSYFSYNMNQSKLLKECEMIYQQWILINGKILSK